MARTMWLYVRSLTRWLHAEGLCLAGVQARRRSVLYRARYYLGESGNAGSILLIMLSVFNGQQGG